VGDADVRADANELAARRVTVDALRAEGSSAEVAQRIAEAIDAWSGIAPGDGSSALLRVTYRKALAVLEQLYRWDADLQDAAPDAERYLTAGHRNAEIARTALDEGGSLVGPLRELLERAERVADPHEVDELRSALSTIALPTRMLPTPEAGRSPRVAAEPAPATPRAVFLLQLGDQPLTGPVLVRPNSAYDLTVEARVLDWPSWADRINVRFLSRWQQIAAEVPEVSLERPAEDAAGVWRAVSTGAVVVRATPAQPDKPMLFTIEAELEGDGRRETIEVLGYSELALHAYDPAVDYITGSEVIDQRVWEVLVEVGSSGVPTAERDAFGRLFRTLANEAQKLVANRTFRSGEHVREAEFQQRLLEGAQSVLGAANVRTGTDVAGGTMDIVYLDTLTAELKVERETPATLERAPRYLGQPAQYAAGAGRQLSILCILDVTDRAAPVGVLANNIGVLRPALAGMEDPSYPTLVGVIVASGGLPLPSDWAGTRVAVA
jgi:hypothetical protein